jgi:tripartite-type tricarboxylate transporter receptor subunit TctC
MIRTVFHAVTLSLCAAALFPSIAAAETTLPPTVTMVVGSAAGGGFDKYGRLTAKYVKQYLPGQPSIVVQNMPGAGGIKSLTWLYNTAEKDGKHFALISAASAFAPLIVDRPIPYDPPKFTYLISLNKLNNMLLVWHTTPFHRAEQIFKQEMILGNSSGPSAIIPAMMNRLVGTKFKVIGGYKGTNNMALAIENGEVQGSINYEWDSITGSRTDWLNNKKIRIIMQMTMEPVDDPLLKGIPYIGSYVTDPESRDILEILLAKQKLGRPFMGPPGMAPDAVATYRAALTKTVNDPAFLKAAEASRISINPVSGEELTAFMKRIYSIPESTIRKMREEIKLAEKGIVKRKGKGKGKGKKKSDVPG